MACQKLKRVAEILDLFETDNPAELAAAFAAAAHVEAERDVAELVQHFRRLDYAGGFAIAAKAVQDEERRAPLLCPQSGRDTEHAVKVPARRWDADNVLMQAR